MIYEKGKSIVEVNLNCFVVEFITMNINFSILKYIKKVS